jgi:hypothetical protein
MLVLQIQIDRIDLVSKHDHLSRNVKLKNVILVARSDVVPIKT